MSYVYRHVDVIRVVDGDTARLDIDMGNGTWWSGSFRLNGVDTPERGADGFAKASARLAELLANGVCRVETFKPDKFGRWLADIYVAVDGGEMLVNQMLITEGLGVPYFGGRKTQ